MKIPSGWYAILDSREVLRGKPIAITRFGLPLVAWKKKDGEIVVLQDKCPHRSAKLSLGKIINDQIECPFHGFQFDKTGECKLIPEIEKGSPQVKTKSFRVIVKEFLVWVWWGDGEPKRDPLWFANTDNSYSLTYFTAEWDMHISRCIENQLDYAHLPYVHRTTIGKGSDPRIKAEFELSKEGMNVLTRPPSSTGFQFLFPNIWQLRIAEKLKLVIIFVPVSENKTRFYLRTYQKIVTLPVLRNLFGVIMNYSNKVILNQDKRVVYSQEPSFSITAEDEQLMYSDKAIRHFREWWRS